MDARDVFLWAMIAVNLGGAVWGISVSLRNLRQYRKYDAKMQEITGSPQFTCAQMGHDLELDVLTLDRQEPPTFVFTHMFKWTCRRCEFEDTRTMRQVMLAPDVEHMTGSWLNLEGAEE